MKLLNTRRAAAAAVVIFVTAACAFSNSLPSQWGAWRYIREIQSEHPEALNYIAVGPVLLQHSAASISDLRIVDESGAETPYVLRTSIGVAKTESWPATIRENSFVTGQYTQLLLDLGANPRFHDAVRLETPESDFILWVEVDASDDARTWRIVKDRAPISRFRHASSYWEGNQTVDYSENNARYLRVQIRQPENQFPVTAAEILPSSRAQKEIVPQQQIMLQGPRSPDDTTSMGDSAWGLDLGSVQLPVSSLEFTTDQKEFYRSVYIGMRADPKESADEAISGEIYRYVEGTHQAEKLNVPVNNSSGKRLWYIVVHNLNDQALSNLKLSVFMTPKLVLFRPLTGHSYHLVYGNEKAQPPRYDLERTLHISATEEAFADSLGPEQENAGYQDPRPFSERHPAVLWGSLALAVVLLAYTALRTMRTPPAQQSQ